MATLNLVLLIGNLTDDPKFKTTRTGTDLCTFSIAVSEVRKGETLVTFMQCEVWGKMAGTCHDALKKGSMVAVKGKIRQDKWEDKDGNKRSRHKIMADDVQFLQRAGKSQGGGSSRPYEQNSPPPGPSGDEGDDIPF